MRRLILWGRLCFSLGGCPLLLRVVVARVLPRLIVIIAVPLMNRSYVMLRLLLLLSVRVRTIRFMSGRVPCLLSVMLPLGIPLILVSVVLRMGVILRVSLPLRRLCSIILRAVRGRIMIL